MKPKLDMSNMTALHFLLTNGNSDSSRHLISNHPSWSHVNWSGAEFWKERISVSGSSMASICKACCFLFVESSPLLQGLAGRGRASLVSSLAEDEMQVFRVAELLQDVPSLEVLEWWNYFKNIRRQEKNQENSIQGAEAELWTMVKEEKYLDLNIPGSKPKLVSIDSDFYGFDIRTFRKIGKLVIPTLLEVKSFAASSCPVIFITRTEWEKAVAMTPNYFFTIWCMETQEYRYINSTELQAHIPKHNNICNWEIIKLDVSTWW